MPRKLLVGVQRTGSVKGVAKKVAPPSVPNLSVKAGYFRKSPCIYSGHDILDICELDTDCNAKPPRSPPNGTNHYSQSFFSPFSTQQHPMRKMTHGAGSNGQIHLAHVIVHSQPDSLPSTPSDIGHSPCLTKGRLVSGTQASLEDQGIDLNSPGRYSPGGSSGSGSSISRHSLSSLDSGRASAPGSDGKVVNRRLSIQSYEGSSPQRRSYHSSSSSIASVGEDLGGPLPNVAEMVLHGLPDVEVMTSWLATLHFEEYIPLFLLAGYDMPTITRMTPEDLTAIGIKNPNHRRKLKAEIAKLNISDGIPEYKPDSLLEWLQLLRLEDYFDTLCQQNYNTVDKVTDITWEDLEDIGISKLGHQKRILLAIKRIEDINHGRRPNLYPQTTLQNRSGYSSTGGCSTFPRPATLSNAVPHYPSHEIAISTPRPKSSPSTDSIPELKTFQQSPLREDNLFLQAVHKNLTQHQNGGLHNSLISPTRVRSLESLHADSNHTTTVTTNNNITTTSSIQLHYSTTSTTTTTSTLSNNSETPPPPPAPADPPKPKNWRVTDLDESAIEGTATLNRPKGLVRLRPMASPAAIPKPKTRVEIAEAIMDIPDSDFKNLFNNSTKVIDGWSTKTLDGSATKPSDGWSNKPLDGNSTKILDNCSSTKTLDGWSSLDGSPRHVPTSSTVPRNVGSRRPPPPPPPKRMTKGPPPPEPPTEDFPPPPAPLPSVEDSEESSAETSGKKDELFNNPLFKQRRKDSSESVESSALHFANEAVGTIKQKATRPYPAIPAHQRNAQKSRSNSDSSSAAQHEYNVTSEAISPGDVIDDIENMLANLSDQLDAMLDDEVQK